MENKLKVSESAVYRAVEKGEPYSYTLGRYFRRNGIPMDSVTNISGLNGVERIDFAMLRDGWNTENNLIELMMEN